MVIGVPRVTYQQRFRYNYSKYPFNGAKKQKHGTYQHHYYEYYMELIILKTNLLDGMGLIERAISEN